MSSLSVKVWTDTPFLWSKLSRGAKGPGMSTNSSLLQSQSCRLSKVQINNQTTLSDRHTTTGSRCFGLIFSTTNSHPIPWNDGESKLFQSADVFDTWSYTSFSSNQFGITGRSPSLPVTEPQNFLLALWLEVRLIYLKQRTIYLFTRFVSYIL